MIYDNYSIRFEMKKHYSHSTSSKLSNVWEKSIFQIRQNYPAPVGFLPESDLEKVPDFGWSRSRKKSGTTLKTS